MGVLLVGWVLLMAGLTRWQRSRPHSPAAQPPLIHYPGTESAPEQTAEATGFHRYWFHLDEDYPSLSVYSFYQQQLQSEGWRPFGEGQPQWTRREDKNTSSDLFHATWISPNGLFQIDLEMVSTVKVTQEDAARTEHRQPGLDVFVTMQRVLLPGIATPMPEPQRTARPQIQVK
jgi:hypothetical protein